MTDFSPYLRMFDEIISCYDERDTFNFFSRMRVQAKLLNLRSELQKRPLNEEKIYSAVYDIEMVADEIENLEQLPTYLKELRESVDEIVYYVMSGINN